MTHPTDLSTIFAEIEQAFSAFREARRIPGLAFGIVIDGQLAYANGLGEQNTTSKLPVSPDSVFRIASMTKSFTAMSIVKLRDEGRLRLDDPAVEYVPELAALRYPTRDSAPITVRDLLTMGAGFPQDDPWADRQLAISEAALTELLHGGFSFSNPPNQTFEYSNLGYGMLGRIITNVAGMAYQDYVTHSILEPLGMTSSTFDVHKVAPERLAMGYRLDANERIEDPPLPDGAFGAMGGLFTTIRDFARYMAFLLSAFPARDDEESGPIKRSSAREMMRPWRNRALSSSRTTPNTPAIIQSDGYGYGLVSSVDSVLGYSVAHGGGLPGYGSFYRLLPDLGIGVAAFSNLTYAGPAIQVGESLARLKQSGQFQARVRPITAALAEARDGFLKLYAGWDDKLANDWATATFFQDAPGEKRSEQLEQLRNALGVCLEAGALEPENALRGRWRMRCEKGLLDVFLTLSPTVPPRVQYWQLTSAKPLSPALRRAATRLLRLIGDWDDVDLRAWFAPTVQRTAIRAQLEAVCVQYGALRLGDVLEGDGDNWARVRLVGERANLDARLVLNPKSGKIRELAFTRPREDNFVP